MKPTVEAYFKIFIDKDWTRKVECEYTDNMTPMCRDNIYSYAKDKREESKTLIESQ